MKIPWTHVLAFVAGMLLTIGVYEARRLVRNTARAVNVAQGQLTGEPVVPPAQEHRREALSKKVEENPDAARRLALQLAKQAREADGGLMAARQKRLEERREKIKAALAKMTPEQIEELKRRRAQWRARNGRGPRGSIQPNQVSPLPAEGRHTPPEGGRTQDTALPPLD